jgi:hypothetical protein
MYRIFSVPKEPDHIGFIDTLEAVLATRWRKIYTCSILFQMTQIKDENNI